MYLHLSINTADTKKNDAGGTAAGIFRLLLSILLPVLVMQGCAGPARINWEPAVGSRDKAYQIDGIPFFAQDAYQCGPAALAMALSWSGIAVQPADLTPQVYTSSRKGSLQSALIGATRRYDRIAFVFDTDASEKDDGQAQRIDALVAEILAGHPVIVLQNLGLTWFPRWHYAVVIGIDPIHGNLILHSGITPNRRIAIEVFMRTWARSGYWALLALPPDTLPASMDETGCLLAVSALEQMGRWTTAARSYRAVMARWPDSLGAHVGLGVCLYETGDLAAAEVVFRRATRQFPDAGIAFNNLAEVLSAQGRHDEALDAAARAVAIGGPLRERYQETLESIRRR